MQNNGARRPSMNHSSSQPPPSGLPRPVISTNVGSRMTRDSSSPFLTTTPEAINFYCNDSLPISEGSSAQSFDAAAMRSVSDPPQNAPRQVRSQPRLMNPKRSVRDLASQFNEASNGIIPLPIRPTGLRNASASSGPISSQPLPTPTDETRTQRKLQKSPPQNRRSAGTPERRSSETGSIPSSPIGTFQASTPKTSSSSRTQYLFGEIDPQSMSGLTVPHGILQGRSRRVSEGGISQSVSAFAQTHGASTGVTAASFVMRPVSSHLRSTSDSQTGPSPPSPIHDHSFPRSATSSFASSGSPQKLAHMSRPPSRIPRMRNRDDSHQPRSPVRRSITPPQVLSYNHFGHPNTKPGHTDQRQRSYARGAMTQQSPRLRSSRSRQQVSSVAPTAASSFDSRVSSPLPESRDSIIDDRTYTPPGERHSFSQHGSNDIPEVIEPSSTPPITSAKPAAGNDAPVSTLQRLSNAIYYGSSAMAQQLSPKSRAEPLEHHLDTSAGAEGATTDIEDDAPSSPQHSSFVEDDEHGDSAVHTPDHVGVEPMWPKPPSLSVQTNNGSASRNPPILIAGPGQPSPAMSTEGDNSETIHIILGGPDQDYERGSNRDMSGNTSSATPIQYDLTNYLSPWTANVNESPNSRRLTLDNDGYNMFHNIIQHYQESGAISPQMIEEVERHMIQPDSSISPRDVLQEMIQEGTLKHHSLEVPERGQPLIDSVELHSDMEVAPPARAKDAVSSHFTPTSRLSIHTDIEDNISSAAEEDRHDDSKPKQFPKDTTESPMVGSDDGTTSTATQRVNRYSAQTFRSTGSERPSLPEIQDTGGGLGLLGGEGRKIAVSPFASATSVPVELAMEPSPREQSGSYSIGSSEAQQGKSGMGMATPERLPQDTPSTSVSHPPSFASAEPIPRINSVDRDLAPTCAPGVNTKDERRLIQRRHCINELINTEFTYHRDMTVVEDIYIATASSCSDLTVDDTKVLFGNTPQLVSFSRQLADSLKEATRGVYQKAKKQPESTGNNRESQSTSSSGRTSSAIGGSDEERDRQTYVGEVFLQNMPMLEKIYSDYLRNHDAANQRLAKIITRDGAKIWLNECHNYAKDLTGAWNLDSMLIKPTQRLLKYSLLLDSILKETAEDHPDYMALDMANKEVIKVTERINDAKKRAELVEQVVNPRVRRDLDVTKGFQKAFGRRAEKLRQQVGITEAVEDPEYRAIAQKFGAQFLQLQVAMKDVEVYRESGETFMKQYMRLAAGLEEFIDIGPSHLPEIESKWRRWALTVRELYGIAWTDHTSAVQRHCIDPMRTLLGMFERPQTLMAKRKKRLAEYAKYKTMKDKGEKIDKKTAEQAEQFMALNDTLKDELPRLFANSARLVEACLKNFIQLTTAWVEIWRRKMITTVDVYAPDRSFADIIADFNNDHQYTVEDVTSLSICNGCLINETSNFLASSTTIDREEGRSKRPSISSGVRKESWASQSSTIYRPAMSNRTSEGSYTQMPHTGARPSTDNANGTSASNDYVPHRRMRSSSGSAQHRKPLSPTPPMRPPPVPGQAAGTFFIGQTPPLTTAAAQSYEAAPRQPARTQYSSHYTPNDQLQQPAQHMKAASSNTYNTTLVSDVGPRAGRTSLPSQNGSSSSRGYNVFQSALPMTDNRDNRLRMPDRTPTEPLTPVENYKVLFLAASLFEFSIDRTRTEAGYPYLEYHPGEIFDVIGEKGELWLAKNQDDDDSTIGWIWEKHFAKLVSTDIV